MNILYNDTKMATQVSKLQFKVKKPKLCIKLMIKDPNFHPDSLKSLNPRSKSMSKVYFNPMPKISFNLEKQVFRLPDDSIDCRLQIAEAIVFRSMRSILKKLIICFEIMCLLTSNVFTVFTKKVENFNIVF